MFRILACFFEGVVGAICCTGILEFWSSFAPGIFPQSQENQTKGAAGEAKIGPRGYPHGFRKIGRKQNALQRERITPMAPKWEPQSEKFMYFR